MVHPANICHIPSKSGKLTGSLECSESQARPAELYSDLRLHPGRACASLKEMMSQTCATDTTPRPKVGFGTRGDGPQASHTIREVDNAICPCFFFSRFFLFWGKEYGFLVIFARLVCLRVDGVTSVPCPCQKAHSSPWVLGRLPENTSFLAGAWKEAEEAGSNFAFNEGAEELQGVL